MCSSSAKIIYKTRTMDFSLLYYPFPTMYEYTIFVYSTLYFFFTESSKYAQNYRGKNRKVRFLICLHLKVALPRCRMSQHMGNCRALIPSPLPLSPSGAPTDHPYTLSLYLLGRSVGRQRGGGVEGEQSSSISLLRNSCASSALMKIVPYSSSVYTVFHSVIYNSVEIWHQKGTCFV